MTEVLESIYLEGQTKAKLDIACQALREAHVLSAEGKALDRLANMSLEVFQAKQQLRTIFAAYGLAWPGNDMHLVDIVEQLGAWLEDCI